MGSCPFCSIHGLDFGDEIVLERSLRETLSHLPQSSLPLSALDALAAKHEPPAHRVLDLHEPAHERA